MQRPLIFAIVLAIAAVLAGIWWFASDPAAPPPAPPSLTDQNGAAGPAVAAASSDLNANGASANLREAVAGRGDVVLDDPDIRAGLCGFRGRIVDHQKTPVADCGVRMYRGALDSVLKSSADLFAELPDFEPEYIAAEVRTADDGTFQMTGIWPRGFFMMYAGIGTDAPTHQVVTKVPSPGQIIDLGDVVLNDAGVIVGSVYDQDGNALAGALVRAADVPGTLAAFFPAERFDPEGALLIREPRAPIQVVRMPAWVKRVFDHLPIPMTRTDSEGNFRLVGVVPGSNMLAVTAKEFLSHVKPSVQVRAGAEKNVGRIRMRRGEELYAKVLDEKGEAVAGAEVVAGSTLSMLPVDFASYLGETNDQGEAEGTGFSPGKVTIAARRTKNDPWVLAKPQAIISDVIVTLPASYHLDITVQLADGSPVTGETRFRLLQGKKGDGAAEMYMLGFAEPVRLEGRMKKTGEGLWRIDGLAKGTYTLLAEVAGSATGSVVAKLDEADASVTLELGQPKLFSVMVVNQDDQPVRNVAVFAEPRGKSVVDIPINCGRTGKDGVLTIDKIEADRLRVSAQHPLWGTVHGETKPNEQLVLRLLAPGTLRGVLSENGKPPLPGKFTVAVMRRRGGGPRGPLQSVPQMVTAGLDGTFEVTGLQPGNYWVGALESLDALRSPGAIFEIAQSMYISSNVPEERVDIVSGQAADVRLEVGKKPLEGPTAQLSGTVMINSRAAEGATIVVRGNGNRFGGNVDERGRFDLGVVSAGSVSVSISAAEGGIFTGPQNNVWSGEIKLAEGELRDLTIDIATTTISGVCVRPDGGPAARVFVSAQGRLTGGAGRGGNSWKYTRTNQDGSFSFKDVSEGTWSLEFNGRSDDLNLRAKLPDLVASNGSPTTGLRIQLESTVVVKGRVDLGRLNPKPKSGSLTFYRLKLSDSPDAKGDRAGWARFRESQTFECDDLMPGRYRIRMDTRGDKRASYVCGVVDVPAAGLEGMLVTPQVP